MHRTIYPSFQLYQHCTVPTYPLDTEFQYAIHYVHPRIQCSSSSPSIQPCAVLQKYAHFLTSNWRSCDFGTIHMAFSGSSCAFSSHAAISVWSQMCFYESSAKWLTRNYCSLSYSNHSRIGSCKSQVWNDISQWNWRTCRPSILSIQEERWSKHAPIMSHFSSFLIFMICNDIMNASEFLNKWGMVVLL